jgi:hypothetical protein
MHPQTLDCRDMPAREAGLAILGAYNAAEDGAEFPVLLDSVDASLRIWLIEAGAKHRIHEDEGGGWLLTVRRGLSPGQGTIPGLHHVTAAGSGIDDLYPPYESCLRLASQILLPAERLNVWKTHECRQQT